MVILPSTVNRAWASDWSPGVEEPGVGNGAPPWVGNFLVESVGLTLRLDLGFLLDVGSGVAVVEAESVPVAEAELDVEVEPSATVATTEADETTLALGVGVGEGPCTDCEPGANTTAAATAAVSNGAATLTATRIAGLNA